MYYFERTARRVYKTCIRVRHCSLFDDLIYYFTAVLLQKPRFRNWYLCKGLLERFTFVFCEKLDNL